MRNGADVVVPLESIQAINERFANTPYGFFLGKRAAYPVVANYVRNTWSKYRLVKSMLNSSNGSFFFQFSSKDGLDAMLENGPWSSFTRAMIELRADVELKDTIVVAMPKLVGFDVAKNLKNPRQAARGVPVGPKWQKKKGAVSRKDVSNSNPFDALNSVKNDKDLGTWGTSKSASKGAKSGEFLSDEGFVHVTSTSTCTTPIVERIDKLERQIIDGKLR
ncbi:transposon ty3-G gag-pol polyprotein [Tanacetum coccineum]